MLRNILKLIFALKINENIYIYHDFLQQTKYIIAANNLIINILSLKTWARL